MAYGDNYYEQLSVPERLKGVSDIASGGSCLALVHDPGANAVPLTNATVPAGTPLMALTPRSSTMALFTATGLPEGVTIDSATGLISGTPVSAGLFLGNVTVTDHLQSRSWPVSIIITPGSDTALAGYAAWRAAQLSEPELAAMSAPLQDADGDGLANLLEYALGTPPADLAHSSLAAVAALHSFARNAGENSPSRWTSRLRRCAPSNIAHSLPAAWTLQPRQRSSHPKSSRVHPLIKPDLDATDPGSGDGMSNRFCRLAVTLP